MMIELFLYGCNCGVNGALIRKLKRYAKYNRLQFQLHESKYSESLLAQHIQLLKTNNLPLHTYPALVLYNDKATLLREWNL